MPTPSPPLPPPAYPSSTSTDSTINETPSVDIPIEIVTEEEMAFIEAALSAAAAATAAASSRLTSRPWAPLSPCRRHGTSARLVPRTPPPDIEDSAVLETRRNLFHHFRSRRGLTVTDLTATEWCEKQMEFSLVHGKPRRTDAMIAGSNRHLQLEEEVIEKVQIQIKSIEDSWAVKILNFITGTSQLLCEGVTRELPLVGSIRGLWLKGVIDEVRMPRTECSQAPLLVETKTRGRATLPSEAQKRNARLQLMCYKYLWDILSLNSFPKEQFFQYYGLNPINTLSDDVSEYIASLGFRGKTLEDVMTCFGNTCSSLPRSQEQLLLRYELQSTHSLLEECRFDYDEGWFENQIKESIEFWSGKREATYVSEAENWKCRFCAFATMCPRTAPASLRAPC